MQNKDTNPKDAVGTAKVPFSCLSAPVMAEVALAMMEGARKYGRHNYRVTGVRHSIYYDACLRHLTDWWEGIDIDPDSGMHHIVKALACLFVLRDSMLMSNDKDDRPPRMIGGMRMKDLNRKAKKIIEMYPDAKDAYTHKNYRPAVNTMQEIVMNPDDYADHDRDGKDFLKIDHDDRGNDFLVHHRECLETMCAPVNFSDLPEQNRHMILDCIDSGYRGDFCRKGSQVINIPGMEDNKLRVDTIPQEIIDVVKDQTDVMPADECDEISEGD